MQTGNTAFLISQVSPDAVAAALANAEAARDAAEGDAIADAAFLVASLEAQAADLETRDEPIRLAIRDAIEVGVVVPSILRANLEAAKFRLLEDDAALAEYGFASLATLKRTLVCDKAGTIVAMGAAGDRDEAILAAMLGWCREHPLEGAAVPAGIATAPSSPSA